MRKNPTTLLTRIILLGLAAVLFSGACSSKTGSSANLPAPDLSNHPIYSSYNFGQDESVIDIGIQPLWAPVSAISEVMGHDKILQDALEREGFGVQFHPFKKGIDLNYFIEQGDLEAGIGGDMPTLIAVSELNVEVVAVVQEGFTSIVANKPIMVSDLRGKRIGFPQGSLSHYALLKALSTSGIPTSAVTLVLMDIDEMPAALESGTIDAFSGWEPAPTISISKSMQNHIVQRTMGWGFLYFSPTFSEDHPEIVRLITASSLRALNWMQQDDANLLQASQWALEAEREFGGDESKLSAKEYSELIREDILAAALYPHLPERDLAPGGRIWEEFQFLKDEGLILENVSWATILSHFSLSIIPEILAKAQVYELDFFQYSLPGEDRP